MPDGLGGSDRRQELIAVIHRVRRGWRFRLALGGAVFVVGGMIAALLIAASTLEVLRFLPAAIIGLRVLALVVFATLVVYGLVLPLRRRVSDAQVALYLEERNPSLQAALLSAIESSTTGGEGAPSPKLVERIVEDAIAKTRAIDHGLAMERDRVKRHAFTLAGIVAAATLLLVLGPAFLRQGVSALLIVSRSAQAASPYRIDVVPGDASIPRGADQTVTAKLIGFSATTANLMMHSGSGAPYEHVALVPAKDPSAFEAMLFHVEKSAEYYVESNGVRSPTYSLSVLDLPTVARLVVEYRFPAYTGLQPRTVEPGGDVAALKGTEVRLTISPTMATKAGRIALNDTTGTQLTAQPDGTLAGAFTIGEPGFYKIELDGPHGEKVAASPQYTIDVLKDQPPSVAFAKPGADTSASPVEEVFAQVRADDDFGVKHLQMFYSVNGGKEKTVELFNGPKTLPEVTATHTIYLEELGLKPGDFVSYYAKATDNDAVEGTQTSTSDIYFVQIRPFRKDYKAAQTQANGGGGGQGQQVGQLSQQQRQIVAATFNSIRDRAKMTPEKFRENLVFLTLAQAKLREQVEELGGKMNSRLDAVDPAFKTIADALPKAAAEMKTAEALLNKQQAQEALAPEQRALKLLQDAEQNYEMEVASQRGGGGGQGAGAGDQMSEDLADLFELELDKLANQYEMQQRAEQQSGDKEIDALAEKLKELARRQQQELERQRRMSQGGGSGSAGGSQQGNGESQRQLAQELEEAARRLEQLTRDQPQQQNLRDAANQLQDAANAMRQAAANGSKDGGAQTADAIDKLKQAQQRLERNQTDRGQRDLKDAQRQAQELADDQRDVSAKVEELKSGEFAERAGKAQAIGERKDAMDQKLGDLQDQLEKMANGMRGGQKGAARKLDEAAGGITDKRVREKIRYTKNALKRNPSDDEAAMEGDIGANLERLKKQIGDAATAMGNASKQDALGRAADQARELVRGMESLDQRMRANGDQKGQQQGPGQTGKDGQQPGKDGQQPGKDGQQPGKDGQQADQQGQPGQQGQQGKNQQAQGDQQGQNPSNSQGQEGQAGQQGQANSQGQGGQAGQNGNQSANPGELGNRTARVGGQVGGRFGGGRWNWTPDDYRQFRRELREWQNDAEALRRQLNEADVPLKDFDDFVKELRRLDSDQSAVDADSLQALQSAALERLKRFEFDLRKKAEGADQPLSLSGSDEVPAGFRTAIEEYYRALARKK